MSVKFSVRKSFASEQPKFLCAWANNKEGELKPGQGRTWFCCFHWQQRDWDWPTRLMASWNETFHFRSAKWNKTFQNFYMLFLWFFFFLMHRLDTAVPVILCVIKNKSNSWLMWKISFFGHLCIKCETITQKVNYFLCSQIEVVMVFCRKMCTFWTFFKKENISSGKSENDTGDHYSHLSWRVVLNMSHSWYSALNGRGHCPVSNKE